MSSYINDENNDSCNDFLYPVSSPIDSGYLSCTSPYTSSYLASPTRLSPSIVIYNQLDSPISDHNLQSPINALTEKFVSPIDYENYVQTRKYFDILTQLDYRNASHLIVQILKSLSNQDFPSCLLVCRKWNCIFKDFHRRKQTKKVKRNLFDQTKKLTSTPMQIITNQIPTKSIVPLNIDAEDDDIHLTASTMTFRYGYLKYLHGPTVPKRCPICSFVSIVDTNDQHGICTNSLCRNSFCQCCSAPYHPSSPCKITTGPIKSPWRQRASISPIFSKKTRTTLRRLLIR